VADFVLHRPRREDQDLIERAIEKSLLVMPQIVKGEFPAATTKLHTD
jgi:PTH1 family peptidyl-tRNA hydrolase